MKILVMVSAVGADSSGSESSKVLDEEQGEAEGDK